MQHEMLAAWCYFYKMGALIFLLEIYQMANVNVRNLPDEVHRAIRIQAAQHGRSTEAEIRSILERAARPEVA